jgi:hypothetical protein
MREVIGGKKSGKNKMRSNFIQNGSRWDNTQVINNDIVT